MDASTLRWVLIVIGLVIIGLVFVFGNPERKKSPRASRRTAKRDSGGRKRGEKVRREPTLGPVAADQADDRDSEPGGQGELDIGDGDTRGVNVESRAEGPRRPAAPSPDRIVSLFLLAQDNHVITGAQLLEAAVRTGMDFGEMNIFHRKVEGDSRPIFSLANAAKPGQFDRAAWHEFETGALVLFTTLPNPLPALDAWDSMLATARRMAEMLHAELQDEDHHPFSRRREAQIREEMRAYDRKHGPSRG